MSGERMTSPEEAGVLKGAINSCINVLEELGFERGQIGAALAGIGLALVQVHNGHDTALQIMAGARNALDADEAGRH